MASQMSLEVAAVCSLAGRTSWKFPEWKITSFHHKFLLLYYLLPLDIGIIPFPGAAFKSESKKKIVFQ